MSIRAMRESKNMTQESLAKVVNVSRTTISMWETGKSLPMAKTLVALANYFNCTTDELLHGNGYKDSA